MRFDVRALAPVFLLLIACTHGAAQQRASPAKARAARSGTAGSLARMTERARIVPLVDHHQHIVGPRAAIPWPALAPAPALPPELGRVVAERNRVMGTQEVGDLYTETAQVLDAEAESQP